MKRYLLSLLFLFALSCAFAEPYGHLWWVTSPDGLRMRDKPGLDGNKTGGLPFCAPVVALELSDSDVTIDGIAGKWMRVRAADGSTGWMFGGYLADSPPLYADFGRRMFEHRSVEQIAQSVSKPVSRDAILGAWFVSWEGGVAVSQGGSGESTLSNYEPYTGDFGMEFEFGDDGQCGHGRANSGMWEGGPYSLEGDIIHTELTFYPDGEVEEEPTAAKVDYRVVVVDSTHLQLSEVGTDYWFLCSRWDGSVVDRLKGMRADALAKYIRETGYDTKTFASEDTLLMLAVQAENADAVAWLVSTPWIDVNKKNLYGMTALHYAMRYDSTAAKLKIVGILASKGADVNAVDDYGQTPLDYTLYDSPRSRNNVELRKLLSSFGGKSAKRDWAEFMTAQDSR